MPIPKGDVSRATAPARCTGCREPPKKSAVRAERADPGAPARGLTPADHGHHVVQRLVRTVDRNLLDVAGGLADALLVFHERDAHVVVAMLAEADAGRDRHIGLLHQELGEFEACRDDRNFSGICAQANMEAVGTGTSQPALAKDLDHHVAAALVDVARISRCSSSGPLRAAVAATWTGVKAP